MNAVDSSAGRETLANPQTWPWLAALHDGPDAIPSIGEFRHAFRVGRRWLLIPAAMPAEVYPPLPCAHLPFSQPWCLGLASFRGELAPVYDVGAIVDERAPDIGRYLLLLGRRDACAALCIDEITGMTVAPDTPTTSLPPLPGLPPDLTRGALAVDGTSYVEVDLVGLLGLLAERASLLAASTLTSKDYP
jgi:chemotaxis signal transduction protein